MPAITQRQQEIESFEKQKSQIADDGSLSKTRANSSYNMLLHALIEGVKETTCGQCELICGDNTARTGYSDLPTFYCERFCDAYFTAVDALDRQAPVERELWARARMWKAHLLHAPLWIQGEINPSIYGDLRTPHNVSY